MNAKHFVIYWLWLSADNKVLVVLYDNIQLLAFFRFIKCSRSVIGVDITWLLARVLVMCNPQKQPQGRYYLSARTIAELEPYILDQFAVGKCNVCQKLCVQVVTVLLLLVLIETCTGCCREPLP